MKPSLGILIDMFKVIKILIKILSHPETISSGLTSLNGIIRFALVKKKINTTYELLLCHDRIPWWISFFTPLVVHTDLSSAPVYLLKDNLGGEDPDVWIDQNEERIIPSGFASDQIVNEYAVDGKEIFSATVMNRDRNIVLEEYEKKCHSISMSIPLFDIAAFYWELLQESFVLWKITPNGSTVGYVENSNVSRLVTTWPDCEDLINNTAECNICFETVLKSFAVASENVKVIIYSSEKNFILSEIKFSKGIQVVPIPYVKDIPADYHEVYAIACHKETTLNFVPFDRIQVAKRMFISWSKSCVWLRHGMLAVIVSAICLLLCLGGVLLFKNFKIKNLSEINDLVELINKSTARRNSLISEIKKSGQLSGKESAVTKLISDLQIVFPEGMWSDEIDISEKGNGLWHVNIVALAKSTSLLGIFMNNVHSAKEFSDVRMVYSEQVISKKGEKVIKCRIESLWGD
jgi:hypothetical protein